MPFPIKKGLTKILCPVQFGGGVNTKIDPKQLQAGQLLTLSNAQFSKTGQLNKRYGYTPLSNQVQGGTVISTGVELAAYRNELVLFDGNSIYSYLAANGYWVNRGTAISVTEVDTNIVRKSDVQQLNPDMNYYNGTQVFAYETSSSTVNWTSKDNATGAISIFDQTLLAGAVQPKVIAFQGFIYIFCVTANTLNVYQISPLNPTSAVKLTSLVLDGYLSNFPYDVAVVNGGLYIAYLATGTKIKALFMSGQIDFTGNLLIINTVTVTSSVAGTAGSVNVCGDSSSNIWISWSNGTNTYTSAYTQDLNSLILGTTTVDTVNSVSMTGIAAPTTNTILLAYQKYAALGYQSVVKYTTINTAGTVGAITNVNTVGLASKLFTFGNNIYLNASYQSTLQSTDFTYLISKQGTLLTVPVIINKMTPSIGGGLQTNPMCPETVTVSSGVFMLANLTAGKIISEAQTLFTLFGVNSSQLTFTPSDNFENTVQSDTLLIVGGILQGYDGHSVSEVGFNLFPENITAVAGSTGNLSTGTYQYIVEYQWTDNNGLIYRSSPSEPVSVSVTAGQKVTIAGPYLMLTSKPGQISIVISRTQANGTNFNRVTSTLAPLLNDATGASGFTWSFVDTLSDANALSNELDYTTGAILANIAPPANSVIATFNDRVFLTGMSDPLLMWYSQTVVDNSNENTIPPQFCAQLMMTTDPRGGAITGLGLLNQVLVIFKRNNIFGIQGNGPDATGGNSDYGDPTLITSDVGCINDTSIVIMPQGLMFQSAKGIYLLDVSLNATYIGAPVEAYNGYTITSATLHSAYNQVIFTTLQGTALVYDYFQQQWSTWSNHFAADALIYNNGFYFLGLNGIVMQQNTGIFTDAGSPVLMNWTTPNLAFAGLSGYQRVFRVYILGTYKGPHKLNVSVAYDYNDNYTQFATITPALANTSYWGSSISWGDDQFWGGANGYTIYQFRLDFSTQKCTAIRLMVSDNEASNYNEGYAISSLVFEVGALPGGNRLPTSQTYGAK